VTFELGEEGGGLGRGVGGVADVGFEVFGEDEPEARFELSGGEGVVELAGEFVADDEVVGNGGVGGMFDEEGEAAVGLGGGAEGGVVPEGALGGVGLGHDLEAVVDVVGDDEVAGLVGGEGHDLGDGGGGGDAEGDLVVGPVGVHAGVVEAGVVQGQIRAGAPEGEGEFVALVVVAGGAGFEGDEGFVLALTEARAEEGADAAVVAAVEFPIGRGGEGGVGGEEGGGKFTGFDA